MSQASTERWLLRDRRRTGEPRARLFCIPHAGGGALAYRLWQAGLPEALEVCAVQLPGRENRIREPPLPHIDAMVDSVLQVIEPHLDRPFAIFGHSMGAWLAAEVAVALAARGCAPHHVFVSGRRAPHLPDPHAPLAGLPDVEFVAEINRRYGGIPAEVLQEPEIMELFLPVVRADIAALESYRSRGVLRIEAPLSVFGGTQDRYVSPAQLDGWAETALNGMHLTMFEGDHFFLVPRREQVLAHIATTLAPLL